jgi:hypothetical protein
LVGPDGIVMIDANQFWGVDEAIDAMKRPAPATRGGFEEPTSPDDIPGHAGIRREIAPIRVATGEHVQNRVIFKHVFQAGRLTSASSTPAASAASTRRSRFLFWRRGSRCRCVLTPAASVRANILSGPHDTGHQMTPNPQRSGQARHARKLAKPERVRIDRRLGIWVCITAGR